VSEPEGKDPMAFADAEAKQKAPRRRREENPFAAEVDGEAVARPLLSGRRTERATNGAGDGAAAISQRGPRPCQRTVQ
jgi:hypothetical protein